MQPVPGPLQVTEDLQLCARHLLQLLHCGLCGGPAQLHMSKAAWMLLEVWEYKWLQTCPGHKQQTIVGCTKVLTEQSTAEVGSGLMWM